MALKRAVSYNTLRLVTVVNEFAGKNVIEL